MGGYLVSLGNPVTRKPLARYRAYHPGRLAPAVLCLILPERKLRSIRKCDRDTVCIQMSIHIDLFHYIISGF